MGNERVERGADSWREHGTQLTVCRKMRAKEGRLVVAVMVEGEWMRM